VIVTVTPNPSVDWTIDIDRLSRGELHRSTGEHAEPSGKGVNVSRALASNSMATIAVLPIGGPGGTELVELLTAEGVSFVAVPIAGAVRVNVSLTERGGVTTKINAAGPTVTLEEQEEILATTIEAARGSDWVVAAGTLAPGMGDDFYGRLGEAIRSLGIRFALDTSGTALMQGLMASPVLIKPNLEELAQVTNSPIATFGDAVAAARGLIRHGSLSVLVSAGPDGAFYITRDGVVHGRAAVANPKSAVGAGDALLAGVIAAGGGKDALAEGLAWAAAAVATSGSHVPPITRAHREGVVITQGLDLDLNHIFSHPVSPDGASS
jgi:1-phosphofructokinase